MPPSGADAARRVVSIWSRPTRVWAALAPSCLDEENRRAARFVHAEDRQAYLAAHGLLRQALDEYAPGLGAEPFAEGEYGKPYLAGDSPDVRFNLSHCRTRVCCAVSVGADCGIDVEPLNRQCSAALERATLTIRERRLLLGRHGALRAEQFLRVWTAKEAVIKALGTGLSFPLDALELQLTDDGVQLLEIEGRAPAGWQIRQWRLPDRHVETVAVRAGGRVAVRRVNGRAARDRDPATNAITPAPPR